MFKGENIKVEEIIVNNNDIIQKRDILSTIVFISDLHFDYTREKYCPKQENEKKEYFLNYIKDNFPASVICIVGDCYNDYKKTLAFIKELEKERVTVFFVLGNHDYWNNGKKSYAEIIKLFENETQDFQYFRFLTNGLKYYINEMCFIGDTGWTSFRKKGKLVGLKRFWSLPDAKEVKGFNPKKIISMHNSWIMFANEVLKNEKKTIVLTHFPMTDFTKKNDKECWWSSSTDLVDNRNCWKIFGHTHINGQKKYNHVSAQKGYNNLDNEYLSDDFNLSIGLRQYNLFSFGMLVKENLYKSSEILNMNPLIEFSSSVVVQDKNIDMDLVTEIHSRGFKRCAHNMNIFAELVKAPFEYLEKVKLQMGEYGKTAYIGYVLMQGLSEKTIQAVYAGIAYLEEVFVNDDFLNPTAFVTSAIITGYVYNGMVFELENMRPVDAYDVLRFSLMFQTMKHYGIVSGFGTIRRHKKIYITYKNVDIWLPVIDDKWYLTVEETYEYLGHTSLLVDIEVDV